MPKWHWIGAGLFVYAGIMNAVLPMMLPEDWLRAPDFQYGGRSGCGPAWWQGTFLSHLCHGRLASMQRMRSIRYGAGFTNCITRAPPQHLRGQLHPSAGFGDICGAAVPLALFVPDCGSAGSRDSRQFGCVQCLLPALEREHATMAGLRFPAAGNTLHSSPARHPCMASSDFPLWDMLFRHVSQSKDVGR